MILVPTKEMFPNLSKVCKKYRIDYFKKKLSKHPRYFIEQLNETVNYNNLRKDIKEIYFYPSSLECTSDFKHNKLLLILCPDNFFLCNGRTITDNKKVIDHQLKLKNISDHFYQEYCSENDKNEFQINTLYSQINSLLAAAKCANDKRIKVSQFLNFWHCSLLNDQWCLYECQLETDDFVVIKYRLHRKKHKNYCFNPCLLFGACKEKLDMEIDADENYYMCLLKIALFIDNSKINKYN